MKLKDKKELRAKTKKDLWELLREKREKVSDLRVQKSQNKLKNTREIFHLRKDIAFILTFIKELEFAKTQEEAKKESVK